MKIFDLKSFLGVVLVFAVGGIIPLIFSFKILDPIKESVIDFDITDIGMQDTVRHYKTIDADTNIIMINFDKDDKYLLYQILNKIEPAGPKVIGIEMILKNDGYNPYDDSLKYKFKNNKNYIFACNLIEKLLISLRI